MWISSTQVLMSGAKAVTELGMCSCSYTELLGNFIEGPCVHRAEQSNAQDVRLQLSIRCSYHSGQLTHLLIFFRILLTCKALIMQVVSTEVFIICVTSRSTACITLGLHDGAASRMIG